MEHGRLAYYQEAGTPDFWDAQWARLLASDHYAPFRRGDLGLLEESFAAHLPKRGRVLEAGCGTGQFVLALRARGYDCEGVDYVATTVERARAAVPDLPVSVGDVTALAHDDETFDAVISLGVVEHRYEGPHPFLSEMRRVLKRDGTLLVSVPHFNPLRRLRHRQGWYRDDCGALDFYQWAFPEEEFRRLLREAGLRVVAEHGYDHRKTLRSEIPLLGRLPSLLSRALLRLTDQVQAIRRELGHLRMYVTRRDDA